MRKIAWWKPVVTPFRWLWRLFTFIREVVFTLFFIVLVVLGVGVYTLLQSPIKSSTISPPVKGALLINLSGTVVDDPDNTAHIGVLGKELFDTPEDKLQQNSLFELVDKIHQAKSDHNITGIVLQLSHFIGTDQPSLQYIGKALTAFKESGKPIYAIGDSYTQSQYYLASFADKIYLSPEGSVDLYGIATHKLYYKSLLQYLKISTHIFRVGMYKSAVEPYIRDDMSPAAREADSRWLTLLWQQYLSTIAQNRGVTIQQIEPSADAFIEELKASHGSLANYAAQHKLVDQLLTRPAMESLLAQQFGWNNQSKRFNFTSIYQYPLKPQANLSNKIAVIFANGTIINGNSMIGSVGGETLAAEIRRARLDPKIKAVILRINSPGGSVTAAEMIRDELLELKKTGKPLVVSMGGMGASGGYWIATPANYIIASPSTLTGSIGIFGIINTFEKSLDSIGVHTDGVSTSPLAGASSLQELSPQFKELMQINIEHGYQRFIDIVAESRHKTSSQVDEIAQGHVWIGSDAKENGLVDQLGDFDDAVQKAAELANVKEYQLVWYRKQSTVFELLVKQFSNTLQASLPTKQNSLIPSFLREIAKQTDFSPGLSTVLQDPQYRFALCVECTQLN